MFIYDFHGNSSEFIAGGWLYIKFANGFGISSIHTQTRWDNEIKHKYEIGVWVFPDKTLDSGHTKGQLIENYYPGEDNKWIKEDLTLDEFNAEVQRIQSLTEDQYQEYRKRYFD